jgi:DNA modification methylase
VGNIHPTVKPVALMEYLIKMVTPTNGIVLDPFMGSGSTGVACVLNDFEFVGIDLDKDYCEIARARIEGVKETQTKMF